MQETLTETNKNCQNAFRSYCVESFLCDHLKSKKVTIDSNLEKK